MKIPRLSKKLGFLSPILLCYLTGAIIGNIGFVPFDKAISTSVSEIAVPIAIPLILFSTDFKGWFKLARKTVISFSLGIVSVTVAAILAAVLFGETVDEYWKVSGMLAGLYTGGTPNLVAIGLGSGVSQETLVLTNTSDVILGGAYYLFLITGAKWLFGKFLPPFKSTGIIVSEKDIFNGEGRSGAVGTAVAVGLSVAITAVSVGISMLVTGKMDVVMIMLLVTTFGIAASFVKKIRRLKGTYGMGEYAILIFSLAMGLSIDIGKLATSSPSIFIYTAFVLAVAIIIHLIFAAIFRIDTDTMIITNTAGIYGPAFVGPVASALKNREVIISGLTSGLVGYAVGNYLGFFIIWLLAP